MKQLRKIAYQQKKHIYSLSFVALFIGIVAVLQAYIIASVVDQVFLKGLTFREVIPFLAILLVVFLARTFLSYVSDRLGMNMGEKAKAEFRRMLLHHYIKNPLQALMKGQSGNRVSMVIDAVDEIEPYYSKYYPQMIQSSIVPIIIISAVFWQSWISGVILLLIAPLISLAMVIIGRITKKKAENQMEKLAAFSGVFLDRLQGLVTLKLFGKASEQHDVIRQSSLDYREATMDVLKIAFLSSLIVELFSMFGIALVAFEVGARLVIYNELSFFAAFFVLILAPEFFASLKEYGSAFHAGKGSVGAAKKIIDEIEARNQSIEWGNKRFQKDGPPKIELKNVSFTYEGGSFSIEGVSAVIDPYSETAIVGGSGSGKTTLLHVIAGLYPTTGGQVLMNYCPLFQYKEHEWYQQLTYISQHPYLFSGTIKENLIMGSHRQSVSRAELDEVAEKTGLTLLINELEKGYDTQIGEGGRGLSGGEKQRIALARAFLKRPSVILFDEPTVGLDLQTEQILQQSIKELAQHSTMITVAHRLHTIKNADQVLLMENGSIRAQGAHEELMSSASDYRKIVEAQQKGAVG
ncbi:thiol reductant ABC exporter subunit CydD [Desertibacillus haloalkaliphilus]|uniref:thiol reductant ABC exporter subunit CydD n=1 Tax=Desertibacillus haloalkaliphilus TaxID=1328930 RepID=UPI001C274408|nr:thiol reductant ABC exporter subunit CydD [Desertibacillus haloalkaliphilus]MBU8906201.1 thiol reductant ABC exporter subunit CydD [Desertibacillus haloalkaliphilus]